MVMSGHSRNFIQTINTVTFKVAKSANIHVCHEYFYDFLILLRLILSQDEVF